MLLSTLNCGGGAVPPLRARSWESHLHNDRDPLLSQRSALILLLGVLVGIGAGTVAALGDADPATAVLTGASACGAGIIFFNATIA